MLAPHFNPDFESTNMLLVRQSITELAECIKELVRLEQFNAQGTKLAMLDALYKKASEAKNRMSI